jgi:hypothetical protein
MVGFEPCNFHFAMPTLNYVHNEWMSKDFPEKNGECIFLLFGICVVFKNVLLCGFYTFPDSWKFGAHSTHIVALVIHEKDMQCMAAHMDIIHINKLKRT